MGVEAALIQETKISGVSRSMVREIWGPSEHEGIDKDAEGLSRESLCIWQKDILLLKCTGVWVFGSLFRMV